MSLDNVQKQLAKFLAKGENVQQSSYASDPDLAPGANQLAGESHAELAAQLLDCKSPAAPQMLVDYA